MPCHRWLTSEVSFPTFSLTAQLLQCPLLWLPLAGRYRWTLLPRLRGTSPTPTAPCGHRPRHSVSVHLLPPGQGQGGAGRAWGQGWKLRYPPRAASGAVTGSGFWGGFNLSRAGRDGAARGGARGRWGGRRASDRGRRGRGREGLRWGGASRRGDERLGGHRSLRPLPHSHPRHVPLQLLGGRRQVRTGREQAGGGGDRGTGGQGSPAGYF